MKRCCDSSESLSSIILSTPFFPRTTGTPIETAEQLYSPCGHVETLMTRFLPLITASAIVAIAAAGAYVVAPLSLITSAPEVMVCWTILSICAFVRSVVIGIPETLAYSINGTIVSPCSPMTRAFVSSLETLSSCAMYVRNRWVSRMLPMPKMWLGGSPDSFRAI